MHNFAFAGIKKWDWEPVPPLHKVGVWTPSYPKNYVYGEAETERVSSEGVWQAEMSR